MTEGVDEATRWDRLVGDWRILQLTRGHRFNTDDVITAWTARQAQPEATRVLDLGAGVGSIGLIVLAGLGAGARLHAVEVQARSTALLRQTVARNGLHDRVQVLTADLRTPGLLAEAGPFDLVCANPPYVPVGRGRRSPHPQRAAARMELHGDVHDYVAVAAAQLSTRGRLVLCHAATDPRPAAALSAAGLHLRWRRPVTFRAGRAPGIAVYVAGREPPSAGPSERPLVVRDRAGDWTAAWRAVRAAVGLDG